MQSLQNQNRPRYLAISLTVLCVSSAQEWQKQLLQPLQVTKPTVLRGSLSQLKQFSIGSGKISCCSPVGFVIWTKSEDFLVPSLPVPPFLFSLLTSFCLLVSPPFLFLSLRSLAVVAKFLLNKLILTISWCDTAKIRPFFNKF